ncbi:sugar phosphate isomerase/epimerase family protein [Rhizobium leguminosarum]|uniref:Sugar phosphate isomerase/epimerase n=1 Tax=Rhizobium leguminosarum TaxID=384 RepID=A0ABD7PID3_RHILE|nr:sugar phosphate isomerase/epimerase [Rhizobium leguminosarum]TAV63110.1 sugar phosphate isomerase/epimerase [Rhizobium leguminosarum]TAV67173.1 sugar phosphate isomerase/epimerase [Rhizobium leguminosarum]TAW24578.1 sugar phosphate isomerase/epimerase [Rhizobium leguminosarum]TAW38351.1 sugar phosphate isomerase/epimerase [Rhizobium leguminosarum]TAZ28004.1 sugar phosphate isomerase/epimerase [Rhizobium leguminosarum]
MKLGIFAKTFEGTEPATVLNAVAAAGFTCAQYNMACSGLAPMPETITEAQARAVGEAALSSGVEIVAVSGTFNMIHPDPAVREAGLRRLATLAERCAGMSSALITLCTGTRDPIDQWKAHADNDTPEAWRDLLEAMGTAIEIAERYDVDLGIEPELANVVNSAEKAYRLIAALKSPRIKIVLDPANLFEVATLDEQRSIVSSAIDLLADRIVMAHAKDRNPDGSFATAGKGVLDYAHYLGRLKAIGFEGSLVTHGLSASEAAGAATFLKSSLSSEAVGAGR